MNSMKRRLQKKNSKLLNPEQRYAYTCIVDAIDHKLAGIYFLDAPGGCGKTFLIKTLLASQRAKGRIAIATASSGLAATLLPGGRTVHSTFKVPLNVMATELPMCSIKRGSDLAKYVKDASLLIIDEAPMLHKKVIEALDRTLQDIRSSDAVMGGLITLMCGDFRQILPVIPHGTRANVVNSCLKKSLLWKQVVRLELKQNMRIDLDTGDALFSDLLLKVGNGQFPLHEPNLISLTELGNEVRNLDELVEKVFPNFLQKYNDSVWLLERAILSPLNETVAKINNKLTEQLKSQKTIYSSINRMTDEEEAVTFPIEFLNSIEISGLPPHILELGNGMPVMLLRSLKPPELMNGTRCVVVSCHPNVVEVEIVVGALKGQHHFIPRIPLEPSDTQLPFKFQRRQFPLRPCFAMTINKAQGQTLKCVGLELMQPVFTHGMLYVALSRTGDRNSIYFIAPHGLTRNVVYTEVL